LVALPALGRQVEGAPGGLHREGGVSRAGDEDTAVARDFEELRERVPELGDVGRLGELVGDGADVVAVADERFCSRSVTFGASG
jgi:hypothetical protein